VSYRTDDHLGSTRVETDVIGTVTGRWDFHPFGDQIEANSTYSGRNLVSGYNVLGASAMKFTGKERDAETGLDYFGARYMSAAQGRFTSPDPTRESANPRNPQTWNRYAYTLGNPLVFIDVNGKWPFYVHNKIYEFAFRDVLTAGQIRTIQETSWLADFGPGAQDAANSPRHSMCAPGQNPTACSAEINAYVDDNLGMASYFSNGGANVDRFSLVRFGRAVHTLTDMGSPMHMGPNGPLPWNNGKREGAIHVFGERSEPVNWLMLGQSIRLAIAGFAQAFPKLAAGKDLNKWAEKTITDYVTSYYGADAAGRPPNPVLEDAARQCALGNRAACF
jgi:RHS repeat-associated protein